MLCLNAGLVWAPSDGTVVKSHCNSCENKQQTLFPAWNVWHIKISASAEKKNLIHNLQWICQMHFDGLVFFLFFFFFSISLLDQREREKKSRQSHTGCQEENETVIDVGEAGARGDRGGETVCTLRENRHIPRPPADSISDRCTKI